MYHSTPAKSNLTNLKMAIRSQRNYIKNNNKDKYNDKEYKDEDGNKNKYQLPLLQLDNKQIFIKRTDSEIQHTTQKQLRKQGNRVDFDSKIHKNVQKFRRNYTQQPSSSMPHSQNTNYNNKNMAKQRTINNSKTIKTQQNILSNNQSHHRSIKSERRVISSSMHHQKKQQKQQRQQKYERYEQLKGNKKYSAHSLSIFIPKSNINVQNRYNISKQARNQNDLIMKPRAKSQNKHNSNNNNNRIIHNSYNSNSNNGNRNSRSICKSDRQQRIKNYTLHRITPALLSKQSLLLSKYKNQKLDILTQQLPKIKSRIPEYKLDQNKFMDDIKLLIEQFQPMKLKKMEQNRQIARDSQNYRTLMGKLLYFVGYQIQIRFSQDLQPQFQNNQMVISAYYQIYFALRLKAHLLVLQCYLVLIDYSISKLNYIHAQKYAQKCLLASIYYRQKYYQQKSIQKISMCEYYKGNICQATYLHDNNGQVAGDSIKKIRQGYNQQQQINTIFHHLYETSRFDVRELLNQTDTLNYMKSYKAMVIFKSPRIGLDDSMNAKKDQLKLDIRTMERIRQFKIQAEIMKKQIKRHQNLFTVRRTSQNIQQFRLVKKNLRIDQENQSSQILRAHQSLNRIKQIKKKPIKDKLNAEFNQFCKKVLAKVKQQIQNKN